MRKIFSLLIVFGFFALRADAQNNAQPQVQQIQAEPEKPYMKDPILPSFNILKMDSITVFNTDKIPKGKKTGIMFFDPHCSHCINFTKVLLAGMDSVKDVQFYMITSSHEMTALRDFYKEYNLSKYKNIKVVGRDMDFFFINHYGLNHFPGVVLYDEHKKFIKFFQGEITVKDIYISIH